MQTILLFTSSAFSSSSPLPSLPPKFLLHRPPPIPPKLPFLNFPCGRPSFWGSFTHFRPQAPSYLLNRILTLRQAPSADTSSSALGFGIAKSWSLSPPGRCLIFKSDTAITKSTRVNSSLKEGENLDAMAPAKKMVWMRILEEGVFRFDSSEGARKEAWPSLSFTDPSRREICLENQNGSKSDPDYVPLCSSEHGQQTVTIEFPAGTSFYGTGEVSGPLERTGKRIFSWNSDAWGYGPSTTSLYQSHPWVLAILPDGMAFGVLADTTRRCEVDLRKEVTIKFIAQSSYPIITFGPYISVTTLFTTLSHAIGTIGMPPKWSLGYHQCKWSYEPASRVLEVAKTFREKRLPCDVLWMDIDYMDGFRCFSFDPEKFPDPQGLARDLHSEGFKAVWMLDPGIKSEEGYFVYDSGSSEDIWILKANGKPYTGKVWPGLCVFPDFSSMKARKWWAELVRDFVSNGVDGIWNDMNEPTVFKTVTKTMPEINMHRGDAELGGSQDHTHYHNVYGLLMARSTYEGMLLANSSKRPFVLTRAGYIGSQRFAATWSGDNLSTWEHLHMSIPMALNLGLSGQPLCGPDIGGFAGDATPKLFARWMGIGALLPFSRGHSEKGTTDHEPWAFGTKCEDICRLALARRYRLLPHLYTLIYSAHKTGVPVVSPLFFSDPQDPKLRKVEDSFLLGPVLVSASTSPEKGSNTKETIFPHGVWRRFNFDDDHPDLPLLYLKGGSIIATGPSVQNVGELNAGDTLTLLVALDENGKAEGLLYEDEGDGFDYQQGKFLLTSYEAQMEDGQVVVKVGRSEGNLEIPRRMLNINLLLGEAAKLEATGMDGEEISFKLPSAAKIAEILAEKQVNEDSKIDLSDKIEGDDSILGVRAPKTLIELSAGDWQLKVVPWIGGRIISMVHSPTGIEWLWSRLEMSGYEEYCGMEYRSPGCSEEYNVLEHEILQKEGEDALLMEGDVGGGLALRREIVIVKNSPKVLQINSRIVAKAVGEGSAGFSRLVCLRVHPTFQLRHPTETYIIFTAVDGTIHEFSSTDSEEIYLRGSNRPNGEWMMVDKCANVALVNRFKVEDVAQCLVCWGAGTCNLELWSEERPVSKDTPICISHEYETVEI